MATAKKQKILYLMKLFLTKTDEKHSLTMKQILEELEKVGIEAERKAIYNDIALLTDFGFDIVMKGEGRSRGYSLVSRDFDLAELKLLVDSVQCSKFITAKKSNELIKKIENLTSIYQAKMLHRQVYVANRNKTLNENIYYNVDAIHEAIAENVRVRFKYCNYNLKKQLSARKDGKLYEVSPLALSWDDENYYLVAYDSEAGKQKHYRVDKIKEIQLTDDKREGIELLKEFDVAVYAKKRFGMFDGEEQKIKLLCDNDYIGVIIDRFGKDVMPVVADDEHFTVVVDVALSQQFLGWIFGLGSGVKIIEPANVLEMVKKEINRLKEQYDI
ncbi:MAG: WYL domain-containing protein [Lachnospiraceae bacterium]|nr:WYL domain-containing protein [Lachnospiraceae bacterium]